MSRFRSAIRPPLSGLIGISIFLSGGEFVRSVFIYFSKLNTFFGGNFPVDYLLVFVN
jgi:hypothetical protein